MSTDFIVLGTDTDAGKTTFSLLWCTVFADRYEYWKPLETGDSDSEAVRRLVPNAVVHPAVMSFDEPVAPPLAARKVGRSIPSAIELAAARPTTRHAGNGLLIETFGGPFSPLNDSELQVAFVRTLGLPSVLVGSSAVGAVGRTLAMLIALEAAGVKPVVVVLIGPRDEYAEAEIARHRPETRVVALTPPQTWDAEGIDAAASANRPGLKAVNAALYECRESDPSNDSQQLIAADARTVWHPYTSLRPATPPLPVVAAEAEFLHLADGRRLIDAVSSWWTILHGHRHPPLMDALRSAAGRIDHVLFAGVTHPDAVRFAERILRTAPWDNGRVFFSDNGSTAVEVALKMAYQVWCHRGEPQRKVFVGFDNAYHGDTFGAMSVGRDRLFFGTFEPLLFDAARLPLDPNRLDGFLTDRANEVAAVIVEPLIQGAGGMRMHSPDTLRDLWEVAKHHHVLFIADEVMTGNRTGKRWAYQHAGIAPDLICASKTLTGGILPLAVTLAGPDIVAAFDTVDREKSFFHGHSFTAHPMACAVAAVHEELVARPGVLDRGPEIGRKLMDQLGDLRSHPRVSDIRSAGSIVAMDVTASGGYLASEAERWKAIALDHGVFLRPLGNVAYAMPPLGTSDESLARIAAVFRAIVGYT